MHPDPKRILPVVALVVILGGGYWFYTSQVAAQTSAISASGTIETNEITVSAELSGRLSDVLVAEGDTVKAGDVLAKIDGSLLLAQRDQASAALAAAQANYNSLKDGALAEQLAAAVTRAEKDVLDAQQALDTLNDSANLATAQAESELAHARDLLDKAQQRYNNLNHPDIEFYQDRVDKAEDALLTAQQNEQILDIGSLQASLQAARDFLQTAQDRLGKIQAAIDGCSDCDPKRSVTVDRIPQTLDDAKDAYNDALNRVHELELKIDQAKRGNEMQIKDLQDKLDDAQRDLTWAQQGPDSIDEAVALGDLNLAKAKVADAESHYNDVKAGPDPDKLAAAEARLAAAQAALAAAQAAADPSRLDPAQAQVDVAQAALKVLDAQIAKLTIVAPSDGIVISRAVEPGEVVLPASTILVIANLNDLQITVYVPEDLYGTVSLGQSASVVVDSFPGETFTGKVIHIADQAEFTPRNVQTVDGRKTTVYAIKLTLDNPGGRLKLGMPADVQFGK
jgi:HlyD family secretion protein